MKHYDYIIIGGGCSGLSLAMAMLDAGIRDSIAIVESRRVYTDDRTWCFWDVEQHPHEDIISRRWNKWRVVSQHDDVVRRSDSHAYCRIRSIDFYQKALRKIRQHPSVDLLMDHSVLFIDDTGELPVVHTSSGVMSAPTIFDSRPAAVPDTACKQHFLGWTVQFDSPVFSDDVATLMDFRWHRDEGVQFFYLLPESSTTALVETTYISRKLCQKHRYEKDLESYLAQYGTKYRVLREERGCIPMTPDIQPTTVSRVTPIGTRAGCIRAGTGYGFLTIQRHTAGLIKHLNQCELARRPVRARFLDTMDKILLHDLTTCPEAAPALFSRLFSRTKPEALIRFLSDMPTSYDLAQVVAAAPKRRFVRTMFKCL